MKTSNVAALVAGISSLILTGGLLIFIFFPATWEISLVVALVFVLASLGVLAYVTKKHL